MSRFRKWMWIILTAEFIFLIISNVLFEHFAMDSGDRFYRVEASRVEEQLEETENPDLSAYETIQEVRPFTSDSACNHDYLVADVNGTLYQICFIRQENNTTQILFAVMGLILWCITAGVLFYVQRNVLKPFSDITQLTTELAKGNLSVPVKQEKSRFFTGFLWGMDMLRDKLESDRQQNLDFQKEKKTQILSLSHDIKTPLSAIMLYVKALQTGMYEKEEERSDAYEGIERNAKEIEAYVSEITKASREDFLNLKVVNGEFYLSAAIDRIAVYYHEKMRIRHTDFTIDPFDNLLLKGDEDRIVEILQNILENAGKYGDGQMVHISFGREEDCCLITVENSGTPVKEEEMKDLFDSFYRGSNSKNIPGSGLGLYIARQLIHLMDGEIFAGQDGNLFMITVVVRMA